MKQNNGFSAEDLALMAAVARKRRQREQQLSKKAPLVLVSREGPFGNDYDFPVKYSSFAFFSFSSVVISFSNTLNMS